MSFKINNISFNIEVISLIRSNNIYKEDDLETKRKFFNMIKYNRICKIESILLNEIPKKF